MTSRLKSCSSSATIFFTCEPYLISFQ
jgi:hypothetical protein